MLEKTLESPWNSKEIQPVNPKGNQSWIFIGRTDAEAEAPILWLIGDSLEKTLMLAKIEGKREEGGRGWDGEIDLSTQWTWIWANSGRWWRTGEPGVLQSMGWQRVRHNLEAEQQRTVPDSVTLAHEAPLSMEFSRQEYWTVLPFPSLGDLPNPGMEPKSAVSPTLLGRFFTTGPPGKPRLWTDIHRDE